MATHDNPLGNMTSLATAMSNLLLDTDSTDFTLVCEDKEFRLHSNILAIRSPFFKAAISKIKAENSEMKIEIKDLDSKAMQEVISFMYGRSIGKAPISSLFEAAERFLMDDLKKDVVKIARNSISVENVVKLGQLAEMYNADNFLKKCAEFIVTNDVQIKEEEITPKLASMTLSILKEALKTSRSEASSLKKSWIALKLEASALMLSLDECKNELADSFRCDLCDLKFGSKHSQDVHLSGKKHRKKAEKLSLL